MMWLIVWWVEIFEGYEIPSDTSYQISIMHSVSIRATIVDLSQR